jgi:hypothetical protein
MTLRTKIGSVSGTRQAPIVSVTAFDDAHGTLDYNAALSAAVAAAPATVFNALQKTSEITISEKSRDAITFEIGYTGPGRNVLFINTQAQTKAKKIHHFLAPVGVYTDGTGTDMSSGYTNLKWVIDHLSDDSQFNDGEAVTVEPLTATTEWNFQTSQSFLTDTYFDLIQDYVTRGVCNNAPFLVGPTHTYPAGSLQMVSFRAQQRDLLEWELSFGIAYFKPQVNFYVDDTVKVPLFRGCDYYWLKKRKVADGAELVPKVIAAIVGQAWPLADFTKINLPFQGTLNTRSGDGSGSITTLYDHGITTDVIVYWDGGKQFATLGSHSTYGLSFNTGVGDALPPVGTNVLVCKQAA